MLDSGQSQIPHVPSSQCDTFALLCVGSIVCCVLALLRIRSEGAVQNLPVVACSLKEGALGDSTAASCQPSCMREPAALC